MDKFKLLQDKIKWQNAVELERKLAYYRYKNCKIVFTNGCFDIIHLGHIDYLSKAAGLGDVLILGLNSDASVKRIKPDGRPIQDEISRAHVLAAFNFINEVVLFDDETPYELIKMVQPDVLVKGGDYKPEQIAGFDIVKQKGGEVVILDFIDGYSTTLIEKKIIQQHQK